MMSSEIIRNADREDWPQIKRLLTGAALPTAGAEELIPRFSVIEKDGALIASGALEPWDDASLLRSVAVPSLRSG